MRKLKKKVVIVIYDLLIIICLVGILVTLFIVFKENEYQNEADQNYQELRSYRVISNHDNGAEGTKIDLDSLSRINPDSVGWIGNDGIEIDYPIVQAKDNDYYLNHLFTLEKNKLGAIFMDYRNQNDFSDQNTIIYGHNMKDGSMFSSLTHYKQQNYFDLNPNILIESKDSKYRVDFFAGVIVDGSYESVRFTFKDDEDYLNYIDSLIKHSTFTSDVKISSNDRIVSLVTCSYEYNNARFALYGKLVEIP